MKNHRNLKDRGKIVQSLLSFSLSFLKSFLIIVLAIIITINLLEIVARPLGGSLPWVSPLTLLLFVWLTFIGMVLVFYNRATIRVEFFINFLPAKFQKGMNVLIHFIVVAFMVFILTRAPQMIGMQSYPLELIPGPRYLFLLPIFIGSFFILLISLCRVYFIIVYGEGNGTGNKKHNSSDSANIRGEEE